MKGKDVTRKENSKVFKDFIEAPINFAPTYKYDIFSDDYDTSEKNRIPSYTDRVLFRKKTFYTGAGDDYPGKVVYYGRAELKTSDHRPVVAYIDIDVLNVDGPKRLHVFQDVISSEPPDASIIIQFCNSESITDKYDAAFKHKILQELFGDRILYVTMFEDDAIVMFKEGKDAVAALHHNNKEISGCVLKIFLKSSDWSCNINKAVKLFQNNTVPLNTNASVSPANDVLVEELSITDDSPQPLHNAVAELNHEILKRLNSAEEWHSVVEGYNDPDYDAPKSQPSSGRCSPFLDGEGSISGSPAKLPPRPPPPNRTTVPQRPPPPKRPPAVPPPPSSKSVHKNMVNQTARTKEAETISSPGGDHQGHPVTVSHKKTAEYNDDYVSCPPPSTPPPPPPPQFENEKDKASKSSKNQPKKSEPKVGSANVSNPPPIPSRPRSTASQNKPDQPPPLPARSSLMQSPSASPRKTVD